MRAIDTNVLVRLIARDDPAQTASAEAFVRNGAWVSALTLAETIWVLQSVYALSSKAIAGVVEGLLAHERVALQEADAVAAALELYLARPSTGFTDFLMLELARKAGHLPFGTFDAALGKSPGAERLS